MIDDELVNQVYSKFPAIFAPEKRRDFYFHFGYKTWDDIECEILEHVCEKLPLYNRSKPIEPWIRTIIKNQLANKKRDSIYRNTIENKSMSRFRTFHDFVAKRNSGDDFPITQNECLEEIVDAIKIVWSRLSLRSKKICILYFEKNVPTSRIAQRYGLTRRAVARRVETAKVQLLRELKERGVHTRCLNLFNEGRINRRVS